MDKMPPLEKIYEAYSALADGRVSMGGESAVVASSNGAKTYTVRWRGAEYQSNDSATYWQGYAGYPVIAVLMLQGRLPYDRSAAAPLADIDWTELNKRHKRDYAAAAAEVLSALKDRGVDVAAIAKSADEAYRSLESLDVTLLRGHGKRA